MTSTTAHDLELPARKIPVPTTISDEARATLISGSPMAAILFSDPEPDPNDREEWVRFLAKRDEFVTPFLAEAQVAFPCDIVTYELAASTLYKLTPHNVLPNSEDQAVLYFHGGGYTSCKGMLGVYMAMPFAHKLALVTYVIDYRMPPEDPFPAGLNDGIEAYEFLLKDYSSHNILIAGKSAGGGLAAAFALKARDLGLPPPAACILQTPESDLTESGDSFALNNGVDNFLCPLPNSIALYANGEDLKNPYLSPVFGDFTMGFPPTLLTSGTRDLFLSNTVLLHRALRRAGINAELHIWEAMGHGGFFDSAPEDEDVWDEVRRFATRQLRITMADLTAKAALS